METVLSKFTVLFEEPFWIGVYERQEGQRYEVCKITFGAQPRDYQVLAFLQKNWNRLRFSPADAAAQADQHRVNPKRMIRRQVQAAGIGTKAQQALKQQQEQDKRERKIHSRAQRSAQKERQFSLRQEKRAKKHRGH